MSRRPLSRRRRPARAWCRRLSVADGRAAGHRTRARTGGGRPLTAGAGGDADQAAVRGSALPRGVIPSGNLCRDVS
jgi:hypothetical protein